MSEKEYSVSEAVRLIGVESHVLRYWEEELKVAIRRTGQGHRVYSEEDIRMFRKVKELKEKGIQLKAIRVLLEEETQESREKIFSGQIRRIAGELPEGAENAEKGDSQEDTEPAKEEQFGLLLQEEKQEHLKQFEKILKGMVEEVVMQQNEKLKQAIAAMIREEIEELYVSYYNAPIQEAAAAREEHSRSGIRGLLGKLFRPEK
ncbi:MAG: helix-turn-helix domain-containing protein [Candidatus Choladocola sp.]|nr:helix-turn-helix domain-containing protein [Candidatus Choladocola sp.]